MLPALAVLAACGDGGQPAATPTPTVGPGVSATGKIAFDSDRDGNFEVYVVNADGSGLSNLTGSPALDLGPAWSPDGSRIAFTSDRDGNIEIYVMNADGSGLTRLTDDPAGDRRPAWSPDGSGITCKCDREG
ncbi:MAG: PD40 domain-containing protein, partial [Chloroflexi bacterium]|nr:PD40 domain-containing protein [Chloroflexota bacterium]